MIPVLTAEQMRTVDALSTERYAIPSLLLMETAANSLLEALETGTGRNLSGRSVAVLCGRGNNGGDGAALARLLWNEGADVRVFLFGRVEEARGDARTNFELVKAISGTSGGNNGNLLFEEVADAADWAGGFSVEMANFDVVVDALFGTGLSGPVEGDLATVASMLRRGGPYVLSVDLPSGLDSDKAVPIGVQAEADLTVSFTAPKLANVMPPASRACGKLVVAGIGSPADLVRDAGSSIFVAERSDAFGWLAKTAYGDSSYKKTRGSVLIVAGSKDYTGAAVLAGNSAMHSGAGMVTLFVPEPVHSAVAERVVPEVIVRAVPATDSGFLGMSALETIRQAAEGADSLAIGCGLGSFEGETARVVRELVSNREIPVIVDADGLNSIAPFEGPDKNPVPLILTPHQGEFLRLSGIGKEDLEDDRIRAVKDFAGNSNAIVLLKGERNIIAAPDGRVVINPTGNPGLGKAGNGDNLTGIIAGFAAQSARFDVPQFEGLVAAVYLAGLAGDLAADRYGERVMTATDVRACFAEAVRMIEGTKSD